MLRHAGQQFGFRPLAACEVVEVGASEQQRGDIFT